KEWGDTAPYRLLARTACRTAGISEATGSVGAGTGALSGGPGSGLKGGLGVASTTVGGITISAMIAVNALGSPVADSEGRFWAAAFERGDEFGGLGPSPHPDTSLAIKFRKARAGANTTIGIIATDAVLTKGQAKRLAVTAHDGFARALWPAHTPLDGDAIFAIATCGSGVVPDLEMQIELSAAASAVVARAIARGVHDATPAAGDIFPCWSSLRPA
ncbi:P1 family peptidase, partial [Rhizobiaceae bacterium]|nr:P1 family peptidase [Rhizobiaceae bacterium]